jgi:hypothetical protein
MQQPDTSGIQDPAHHTTFSSGEHDSAGSEDSGSSSEKTTITGATSTVIGGRKAQQLDTCLHQTVIKLFAYLAVIVPLFVSARARSKSEVISFKIEFEALGSRVVESFGAIFSHMLSAVDALSISATSHVHNTNGSWPFVTMLDFDLRGASALVDLSGMVYIGFCPLVTTNNRAEWERYSQKNLWSIEDAMKC